METGKQPDRVAGDSPDLAAANRTYHAAQGHMELLPNYYAWTYGAFRPWLSGTVVELGCGAGLGISSYVGACRRVIAVDHDPALVARVRAGTDARVEALALDLGAADWPGLDGIDADAVLMMDVLEHFADDAAFLAHAVGLLRPGGRLLVKVPANRRRYSPMDEASGHYRRYDPPDLEALAARTGLAVERIRPINRLGAIAYALKNRQQSNFSRSFKAWQLALINRAMPLVRLGDLLPLRQGLSLAAVFRKPELAPAPALG
jgi:SAM-dependent methyltransferase